jgi:hypothetical protein
MADHWRHNTPGADAMRGFSSGGYFAGWVASIVATLGAVLLVAHFGV